MMSNIVITVSKIMDNSSSITLMENKKVFVIIAEKTHIFSSLNLII